MSSDFELTPIRAQFPALQQQVNGQPLIYLDNAATTQKPESVLQAMEDYYRHDNANVHRASHALSARATQAFESARERVQQFLNARSSQEIIWTRGTTEAINLVAHSWGLSNLQAGDEILLSVLEHHANIVPWQQVAARTGAELRVIPLTANGDLDLAAFHALLSPRTRLLAIAQVSNALGTVNPVAELIRAAKAIGAVTLIDGAQRVGDLGYGQQPGARREQGIEGGEIQIACRGQRDHPQHSPGAGGDLLPGDYVGMVLEHREQDFIARLQITHSPAVGHQVDGFRGTPGPDDFLAGAGVQKLLHPLPG